MAVLKFGSIVTEGSGSLGGHTIQHSKGGMQIRTKPIPHGNPSASQLAIRSINKQLQQGWQDLTDAQRQIWNLWPIKYDLCNKSGDHRPLSGHDLWMKYQFIYLYEGFPFQVDPSKAAAGPLGPELILNGTFDNSDYWTLGANWTISDGTINFANIGISDAYTPATLTINTNYRLKFDVVKCANVTRFSFYNNIGGYLFKAPYNVYQFLPPKSYTLFVNTLTASTRFSLHARSWTVIWSLDNISLKQLL